MASLTPTQEKPIIAVLGATGQQGGAVARALLADGRWQVRAVVRSPGSETAQELAKLGIELVAGNLDKPESLQSAFAGAYGVYSVQPTTQGSETEIRQGIAAIDAAAASGINYFIYSSVGGADRKSGVPHFESKWMVEQHLAQSGLPATVVRPVFFMDNFSKLSMRVVLLALMKRYLGEKRLQMIAVQDIGAWVATAFAAPEEYVGKAVEIAGDDLTRSQVAASFKAHGWFAGVPIPGFILRRLPAEVLQMFEWFAKDGYHADIAALRQHHRLLTFKEWLDSRLT